MAKHRSKRYQKAAALVQTGKSYSLSDAILTVKQFPAPKFTPTVTLSFHLGVDPRKSDQMVRGSVSLPHGTGRNVRVAVFAQGAAAEAAIGLAIVVIYFRNRGSIQVEDVNLMKG